jgi:hypothetical protein
LGPNKKGLVDLQKLGFRNKSIVLDILVAEFSKNVYDSTKKLNKVPKATKPNYGSLLSSLGGKAFFKIEIYT